MCFDYSIVLFVTFSHCLAQTLDNPEVTIDQGTLRGKYDTTVLGRIFFSFTGIPYAEPPLGKFRFKDPKPPHKWDGVLNATFFRAKCIQPSVFDWLHETPVTGSEDCLTINVYTPMLPEESNFASLMDVIVLIHGGAFMIGSGNKLGPHYLLDKDIVCVTFNYRIGALGFLSTEDEQVPGNNGLKDQVAALKWIQKNIAAFGGNPDSVTLIGNSAGGSSVHYHYFSPLSKGLFHRGFSSSGTALSVWARMRQGRQKAEQIGRALGCPTSNSTTLIQCLVEKPASDIIIKSKQLRVDPYTPGSPFAPIIEKWGSTPFIDQDPYQLLKNGKFLQIPWMTSVVSEEGIFPGAAIVAASKLEELDQKWDEILPLVLKFNYTVPNELKKQVCSKIRNYYIESKNVPENRAQFIQMIGDRLFVSSAVEAAKTQASSSNAPVYFYYFNYRGNESFSDFYTQSNDSYGVGHADDIPYFVKVGYMNTQKTENDREMSKEFVNLIWSFAKFGKPEFRTNCKFPNVKEGLPLLRYINISSYNRFLTKDSKSLGHTDFWFSLPIQESTNLDYKHPDSSANTIRIIFGVGFVVLFITIFCWLLVCR